MLINQNKNLDLFFKYFIKKGKKNTLNTSIRKNFIKKSYFISSNKNNEIKFFINKKKKFYTGFFKLNPLIEMQIKKIGLRKKKKNIKLYKPALQKRQVLIMYKFFKNYTKNNKKNLFNNIFNQFYLSYYSKGNIFLNILKLNKIGFLNIPVLKEHYNKYYL